MGEKAAKKKVRAPLPTDPNAWGHAQDMRIINGIGRLWNKVPRPKRGPVRGYIEGLIGQRDIEETAPGKAPPSTDETF